MIRFTLTSMFTLSLLLQATIANAEKQNQKIRTFDDLVQLVQQGNIHSIDDLIPRLDPEIRSRYSLVFDSKSPLEASKMKPRVVLWSKQSDFVLSFTGDENMNGGNKLEVMEFDRDQKKFNFNKIEFSTTGKHQISKNDVSCLACHSSLHGKLESRAYSGAHPIWDTYPDWPGVYGTSHQGRFIGSSRAPKTPEIQEAFTEFRRDALRSSRYSSLVDLKRVSIEKLTKINLDVGDELARLQHVKVANLIHKNPKYAVYKKSITSFLEDWTALSVQAEGYERRALEITSEKRFLQGLSKEDQILYQYQMADLEKRIQNEITEYYQDKLNRYTKTTGIDGIKVLKPYAPSKGLVSFEIQEHKNLAKLEFLLSRMGIPANVLEMNLRPGLMYAQGRQHITYILKEIETLENPPKGCNVLSLLKRLF